MSKRWILPVAVVVLWLFVGGPLGSFAGQLASVQENDNAAFLPETAESTLALQELEKFQDGETTTVTVVFEREGGLTGADIERIQEYGVALGEIDGVTGRGVEGPIPSDDGEAAQLVVEVEGSDGDALVEAVDDMRAELESSPDGLTALVGGQGGVLADFVEAFGAIDGLLLLVALVVVLFILVVVYRSPVLPFLVLFSAVLGLGVASAAIYGLAAGDVLDLNGQSQGILFILTIGAATDYSLLVVARFREELRDHESPYAAIRATYRAVWEPVVASGGTVILGLLCLLLSDLSSLAGLGPVGAIGIAAAMLATLTLLPAALTLLGRRAFWPYAPAYGSSHRDDEGIWARVANLVRTRTTAVLAVTISALAVFAGLAFTLNEEPVPQTELFLTEVDSVAAQDVLEAHYETDVAAPVQVISPAERTKELLPIVSEIDGVAAPAGSQSPIQVVPDPASVESGSPRPLTVDGENLMLITLADPADSEAATATVERIREELHDIDDEILVGGPTAINLDIRDTTNRDRAIVIPAILLVIGIVLALLLRSIVAAAVLLVANVLSFGATMGVASVMFDYVFDFPASDPSTLLIAFVFLVALGIDYSIFLMTRVREESLERGTQAGITRGLRVTGGVITSAGVVLAATFAALSVVPILFLAQIAFIVAFGVLLDTLVVRSLVVPAIATKLDRLTWWPSRLATSDPAPEMATAD